MRDSRRAFLARAALLAGTLMMNLQVGAQRVVRLAIGGSVEEGNFIEDTMTGARFRFWQDADNNWWIGSDRVAQEAFNSLTRGAQVFINGDVWDVERFPPNSI